MRTVGMSAPAPRRPGRPRDGAPRVVIVSLDPAAGLLWAERLRKACPVRFVVRPWGDQLGYEYLRRARGALALLDSPEPEPVGELVQRVRSLRLLAPVTVAVGHRTDPEALLAAGAINVLNRDTTASALTARITADLRWLRRGAGPEPQGPARGCEGPSGPGALARPERPSPSHRSQSLLLEILLSAKSPLCCHDARYLLGSPHRPMTLPALRARIQRLGPHLARHGLACRRTVRWGADTFTLHPAEEPARARNAEARSLPA
ncbi:hypothetical protein [Streptomyces sp. NPDC014894]|uniref:hypothetical protein n=1 Tax=unclassified Streptomyces TaxID=2593676 RepID=UPI0036F9BF1A